jgi:hypothetical protein
MRAAVVTLLVALLGALLFWLTRDPGPSKDSNTTAAPTSTAVPASSTLDPLPTGPPPPAVVPPAEPAGLTPEEIQTVRDAIDNLEFTFRDYATNLDGNPVGTNAEITAALRGDNLKQLKLDLPAGSSVNDAGELCDPWGTPWFFHQLSSRKMEIRSAGKDRELYTEDDFVR